MNFKKTLAKSLVVAMALGLVPVANLQTAKAAAPTISFDKDTNMMTASGAKYWGVAKEVKDEKKSNLTIGDKYYSVSNVDEYPGGVDAYGVLKGKTGIIAIGNKSELSNTEWAVKEVNAADSTFKIGVVATKGAVYNKVKTEYGIGGDYGVLVATVGKTPKEVNIKASEEAIQVKLNDGSWQTVKKFFGKNNGSESVEDASVSSKLKIISQSGSTLSFRLGAVSDNSGKYLAFPSKEVKLKVSGNPKAPALKVDTNKDTISLKKGMEYQVKESGEPDATKWKTVPATAKTMTFADLGVDKTKDQIVFARTAATTKKLASKVATLNLKKQSAPSDITGDITASGKAFTTAKLTFETKVVYDITKGATLTNTSDKDYEYFIAWDGEKVDASKVKWLNLKAPKDAKKPTVATIKFSKENKENTYGSAKKSKLFVRLAGTKQNKSGVATMSSASGAATLKIADVSQALTVSGTPNSTSGAISVGVKEAANVDLTVKVSNLQKNGVAPKIKLTSKQKGVTVKSDKFNNGSAVLHIKVSDKAFVDEAAFTGANISFTYDIEGVKETFKYTFSKKS